uniref:Uncharacterized protein n=1 Tax=Glossina pallidipes TaxID=7398 RepID=A0A1B0A0B0_GLOPL
MLENISWEFLVLAALSYDILRRHHCLYMLLLVGTVVVDLVPLNLKFSLLDTKKNQCVKLRGHIQKRHNALLQYYQHYLSVAS